MTAGAAIDGIIYGTVADGPYKGQLFDYDCDQRNLPPRWSRVWLTDEHAGVAVREIPQRFLGEIR